MKKDENNDNIGVKIYQQQFCHGVKYKITFMDPFLW